MNRKNINPFVFVIIGLAVFGFTYRLIVDPLGLMTQIIMYAAIAFGIFFLYKRFMANKMGAKKTSHRPKASFTQQKVANVVPHKRKSSDKKIARPLQKRRTDHNFTVIEGKKNKKKNRALF